MRVYSDPSSERHFNEAARVEAPERFPAAMAGVEAAERAGLTVERHPCKAAPDEAVLAVHDPTYIEKLREMSAAGGGYLTLDTSFGAGSFDVAMLASGAACSAVQSALSGDVAFSIARPPGHHAGRDYGMGFCLLNHVAVATAHARSLGTERIAILDWDVHHGNGTQDIFYADGGVLYLSAHQSPFYPGTGAVREVGEGDGQGFTVNLPLPAGSGEDVYAAAFTGVFEPVLREYRPDCLIVSAGFDSHVDDLLGGMALEAESFGHFAASLVALMRELEAPPPAFVMEGGYDLVALTDSVAATIEGAERGASPEWDYYSGGVKPIEQSRKTLAPFWESLL
ncbi:MAG: histone deacetylase family protein [Geodermatophilaceae bacterium]